MRILCDEGGGARKIEAALLFFAGRETRMLSGAWSVVLVLTDPCASCDEEGVCTKVSERRLYLAGKKRTPPGALARGARVLA